ncbi:MAG: transposase [Saprospiraceae bacterium]|nr:transposase [Saprospiraceae bacterium]
MIKTKDQTGEDVYIGEIEYRPFAQQGNRDNKYRLLVKKKLRKDGQLNMFTNESYDYHAIVTNDFSSSLDEAIKCYNRRGACEKQFDILKNDFGWNYLPFSNLSKILYSYILVRFVATFTTWLYLIYRRFIK